MRNVSLFTFWSFQLPHLLMGMFILLLLLRLLLTAAVGRDRGATRVLAAVTAPVAVPVGAITPRIVPPAVVVFCAIGWLIAARLVLTMVALGFGIRLWG